MRYLVVLGVLLFGLIASQPALSHGGPLDSQGCHYDRVAGGYHCHKGALSGRFFKSPMGAMEEKKRMGVGNAPGAPSAACCVICRKGQDQKACGDACVPEWKVCQQSRGCACTRY